MTLSNLNDINLKDQRVLIREDLNVPLNAQGQITSSLRLEAALPTLLAARAAGAKVMVMSHMGRPREGVFDPALSLSPVTAWLDNRLGGPVRLVRDYLDGISLNDGEVVVLENCRMNPGEAMDDDTLARQYAALCDVFVMDAFGTAHRTQASTHGVILKAPIAVAGPLLCTELDALGRALKHPVPPLLAIVAGAKVSSKLRILENLISKVDQLIIGGGMANTFLASLGHAIGSSPVEHGLLEAARRIQMQAKRRDVQLLLPFDVTVAPVFAANAPVNIRSLAAIKQEDRILDIGPQTAAWYVDIIHSARTIVWNGPMGAFEFDAFARGTETLAHAIARSSAFSIVGGGDTLAAVEKFGVESQLSYLSTGGGAFMEFLEGKELPAITALRARIARSSC